MSEEHILVQILRAVERERVLSANYRARRAKRRQICPACGNSEKVSIRCDSSTGQVVCQCPTCLAMWAYDQSCNRTCGRNCPKWRSSVCQKSTF